ncbi:MAG: DMT family transporter [Candidatus Krumholzibacteria bacterium]|nr:DMT family transporter [Candidatus Krumholzibacteria bacterium]
MTSQSRATLYGLATVLLWSTVASAFELTLRHLEPLELVVYASVVSLVILGAMLVARGDLRLAFAGTRRQYLRSFLLGALNPFLYYLVLFNAYDRLPAQEAQPLNYTWALTLAVLSVPLLGQRIGKRDFAGLGLGYLGVLVVSTHGDILGLRFTDGLGVALALGSTLIWALYWIYSTKDSRDPIVCLFLAFACGVPLVVLYWLVAGEPRLPDARGLLGAAYVGAFEMSVTFALWLYALRLSANTAKVGSLIFISPFISLVLIHFVVGEDIRRSTIAGLVLIVAGLAVQRYRPKRAADSGPAAC